MADHWGWPVDDDGNDLGVQRRRTHEGRSRHRSPGGIERVGRRRRLQREERRVQLRNLAVGDHAGGRLPPLRWHAAVRRECAVDL